MSTVSLGRRALLAAAAAATLAAPAIRRGHAADTVIRIGSLSDLNSVYSARSGPGAVEAARLGAADFMKEHPDIKVEVVAADFQLKPDIGLSVSRSWFDTEGVDCIVDVPMSALALGLSTLARERNKVVMFTSTSISRRSRPSSPATRSSARSPTATARC